jgi:hypothetical protein
LNITYIISAYKHPGQLTRLVHRLHRPTSFFLIHVDRRTAAKQYRKMVSGVSDLDNVVFLKRHNCHWGDFGHVRATLKALVYLSQNKVNYDYLFLLTGQDYPIKSNKYIESYLANANHKQFISYYSFPNAAWAGGGMRRIEQWHFRFLEDWPFRFLDPFVHLPAHREIRSRVKAAIYSAVNRRFPKRTFPENFTPYGGSGYWSITRECAEFIYHFIKQHPHFVKFFKYVDIPDESFFHTIILNSQFRENTVNDDLRLIDFSDGSGPRIWRKQDLPILSQSTALIARKFETTVDAEILNLVDAKLL